MFVRNVSLYLKPNTITEFVQAMNSDSGPRSGCEDEVEGPCVSRVCARWLILPQTFWNYSPVRNEDNMKVCIEPEETWKSPPSSRPTPTLNSCDSQ